MMYENEPGVWCLVQCKQCGCWCTVDDYDADTGYCPDCLDELNGNIPDKERGCG